MKNQIIEMLQGLGIEYRWLDHPPVFTVAEAAEHIKEKLPIKNLLLQEKGEGRKILVIMSGDDRLDTKQLAANLGVKKLQFANVEVLKESLGVTPGSVSVFSLINDTSGAVEVVVDTRLMTEDEIGFHPNDNTSTVFVPGNSLGQIIVNTGHSFEQLKF